MKVCPNCGFIESPYWRVRFVDTQTDIIESENLAKIDIELLTKIIDFDIFGLPYIDKNYAYHMTKKGKWILRVFIEEYKARGNKFNVRNLYDGKGKATKLYQTFNRNKKN